MRSILNPYLSFRDNARAAMEFYQTVFGGKLEMQTFKEYNASPDPSEADKIMHAQLEGDNGIVFMSSDTPNSMEYHTGTDMSETWGYGQNADSTISAALSLNGSSGWKTKGDVHVGSTSSDGSR